MMISKNRLKQLIKEELSRVVSITEEEGQEEDPTKLAGTTTHGEFTRSTVQGGRDLAQGKGDEEMTNQERHIVDKVYSFLMKLANSPGVDLKRGRPALETFLTRLNKMFEDAKDSDAESELAAAEAEHDAAGAEGAEGSATKSPAAAGAATGDAGKGLEDALAGALGGK